MYLTLLQFRLFLFLSFSRYSYRSNSEKVDSKKYLGLSNARTPAELYIYIISIFTPLGFQREQYFFKKSNFVKNVSIFNFSLNFLFKNKNLRKKKYFLYNFFEKQFSMLFLSNHLYMKKKGGSTSNIVAPGPSFKI